MFALRVDDLSGDAVRALLAFHLSGMHANSPACHVNALDLTGLLQPNVTVWSAWDGIGALKLIDADQAEVKSMRTHPDHLRRGVAAVLLEQIIAAARAAGVKRLSLETGRGDAFEPALVLYRRRDFIDGGPFAGYEANEFSQFLHLDL
ncbi:MAG: N-acetyltransferase [Alphaproteobacteria bacterium]|nr:MAG: N-acetyltransferase [Alphaproteobacteria bacterium]